MTTSAPLTPRQTTWLTIVGLSTATIAAGSLAPVIIDPESADVVMAGYRQICHQIVERSFHLNGTQLALCHRCVGIWFALPVAIGLFGVLRRWDHLVAPRPGTVLALSLVPLGVDWMGDALGFWTNTMLSRLLTGAVFGLTAGYVLARVVVASVRGRTPATKREEDTNNNHTPVGE